MSKTLKQNLLLKIQCRKTAKGTEKVCGRNFKNFVKTENTNGQHKLQMKKLHMFQAINIRRLDCEEYTKNMPSKLCGTLQPKLFRKIL